MTEVIKLDDKVSEIIISKGDYKAGIYTLGAILHSFSYKDHDVVVGYDNYEDYLDILTTTYFGEVVGPFANRINNASFIMDGKQYSLEKNDGENNLHSGSKNFGMKYWKIEETDEDSVRLSLESREAGGFPGNHHAEITYSLTDDGKLTLHYVISSEDKCPVNVTNHAYFNLDGKGDARNHSLTIAASEYLDVDQHLIPVAVRKVAGTPFDFTEKHVIGDRQEGKYDHCFIFGKKHTLTLENDEYALDLETDLPAVQVYTGEFLSSSKPGKKGEKIEAFSGIALESEFFPDFPNHPEYPGAYTDSGKAFETETSFRLRRK